MFHTPKTIPDLSARQAAQDYVQEAMAAYDAGLDAGNADRLRHRLKAGIEYMTQDGMFEALESVKGRIEAISQTAITREGRDAIGEAFVRDWQTIRQGAGLMVFEAVEDRNPTRQKSWIEKEKTYRDADAFAEPAPSFAVSASRKPGPQVRSQGEVEQHLTREFSYALAGLQAAVPLTEIEQQERGHELARTSDAVLRMLVKDGVQAIKEAHSAKSMPAKGTPQEAVDAVFDGFAFKVSSMVEYLLQPKGKDLSLEEKALTPEQSGKAEHFAAACRSVAEKEWRQVHRIATAHLSERSSFSL